MARAHAPTVTLLLRWPFVFAATLEPEAPLVAWVLLDCAAGPLDFSLRPPPGGSGANEGTGDSSLRAPASPLSVPVKSALRPSSVSARPGPAFPGRDSGRGRLRWQRT